jgi:hypothetical protein
MMLRMPENILYLGDWRLAAIVDDTMPPDARSSASAWRVGSVERSETHHIPEDLC